MNNKFLTYGLVIVVAIIWSYIFYSIWTSVFTDNKIQVESVSLSVKKDSVLLVSPSYDLKLNYADPFTKQTQKSNIGKQSTRSVDASVGSNVKINQVTTAVKPSAIVLPKVKYVSSITNQKTNKVIAIINIEEKEYMCSNGDMIENIRIQNIGKDSILVECQKVKWYVKK